MLNKSRKRGESVPYIVECARAREQYVASLTTSSQHRFFRED